MSTPTGSGPLDPRERRVRDALHDTVDDLEPVSGLSAIRLNSSRANLGIEGTISATGAAALTVQNGERELVYDPYAGASPLSPYVYPYYYPAGRASIVIGEQGTISGDTGIWIERSSSNYLGDSTAIIDNSGLITASSGAAIKGPATTGIAAPRRRYGRSSGTARA